MVAVHGGVDGEPGLCGSPSGTVVIHHPDARTVVLRAAETLLVVVGIRSFRCRRGPARHLLLRCLRCRISSSLFSRLSQVDELPRGGHVAVLVHPPLCPAGAELHVEPAREGGRVHPLFRDLVPVAVSSAQLAPSPVPAGLFPPGRRAGKGPGVLRARVTDPSVSAVQGGYPVWQGWCVAGAYWSALQLGQVGGEIVDEPAVARDEALGLRGLGVPHDAQTV